MSTSFSDFSADLTAVIEHAATPLLAGDRDAFLAAVCERLAGQPIGPGSIHRAIASAMGDFLRERPLIDDYARAPKYGHPPMVRRRAR